MDKKLITIMSTFHKTLKQLDTYITTKEVEVENLTTQVEETQHQIATTTSNIDVAKKYKSNIEGILA